MMALALCGTAFAGEYNASDYTKFQKDSPYKEGENVKLNVTEDLTYTYLDLRYSGSATYNFTGEGAISTTYALYLFSQSSTDVTGEGSAVTYWESEFLKATDAPAVITLISNNAMFSSTAVDANLTFMGASKNGSVTLGDTDLTYLGAFTVASIAAAKALITNDNEIAVAYVKGTNVPNKGLYLVGKATPAVPEPATATLSLLALASLATRRRRK